MSRYVSRAVRVIGLLSVACAAMAVSTPSSADGIGLPGKAAGIAACSPITLLCENARTYGLCPIGVTDIGEVVTGTLSPAPHYVREVPMRNGYRYAGKGMWFDGKGSEGRLFFGPNRSVACTVSW
jgi:hypothetical protein